MHARLPATIAESRESLRAAFGLSLGPKSCQSYAVDVRPALVVEDASPGWASICRTVSAVWRGGHHDEEIAGAAHRCLETGVLSDRLRNGDSLGRVFVIHTMHVDTTDTRPHGRDRAEDQALSERSDRRGMGPYRATAAEAEPPGAQTERGDAGGAERGPLRDARGRRMAHAAEG